MIEQGRMIPVAHFLKRKIYYIIRRLNTSVGLFSNYIVFAGQIKYALQNGWIPVIDMKNYPNNYLDPVLLGKVNSWEYYFCQPIGGITLEEAYNSDNVILSSDTVPDFPNASMSFYNNENNILDNWRAIVKLGLLRLQPIIQEEISIIYNRLFSKNDKILGVYMRGTDYINLKPAYHPIPPSVELVFDTIEAVRNKWNYNKIFLSAEDYDTVVRFKEKFGNICVTTNRQYINYDGKTNLPKYHSNRPNDFFLSGKEYLTDLVIMSNCNSLIAARCSGSVGVMMMSGGFENQLVFDLGNYPPPLREIHEVVLFAYVLVLSFYLLTKITEVIFYACSSKQFNGYVRR